MIPEKITLKYLEDQIQNVEHIFDESGDDKWVVCVLRVANGYTIEGIAHRQFSVPHNRDVAKSAAYQEAVNNMWSYYTFLSHYKYNYKNKDIENFPKTLQIGDKFKITYHDDFKYADTYILSAINEQRQVCFISVNDGNRWRDPEYSFNNSTIENTKEIWEKLTGGEVKWKKV